MSEYLQKELDASLVIWLGTEKEIALLNIHCTPFGIIPKKSKPGKWRLIVDLSSPEGHSVNDGISKDLAYVSIDDVVAACWGLIWNGGCGIKSCG